MRTHPGIVIDVVAGPSEVEGEPVVGGVVRGHCWLSGRVVGEDDALAGLSPSFDFLAAALESSALSPEGRAWAAWAFGELKDPQAVAPLLRALTDEDATVRAFAAGVLGKIQDLRAVEPLINALEDEASEVREAAAWALGAYREARAIKALMAILEDNDEDVRVREAATEALQDLGIGWDPDATARISQVIPRPKEQVFAALHQVLAQHGWRLERKTLRWAACAFIPTSVPGHGLVKMSRCIRSRPLTASTST